MEDPWVIFPHPPRGRLLKCPVPKSLELSQPRPLAREPSRMAPALNQACKERECKRRNQRGA